MIPISYYLWELLDVRYYQISTTDRPLYRAEVAEKWGISRKTLQAWRLRGGGPRYIKMGRSVRYPEDGLIEFQQAKTHTSTAEVK